MCNKIQKHSPPSSTRLYCIHRAKTRQIKIKNTYIHAKQFPIRSIKGILLEIFRANGLKYNKQVTLYAYKYTVCALLALCAHK